MAESPKDRYLSKRFTQMMTGEQKQLAEGTAFFEVLFPMISSRKAYDLKRDFFDLSRSARIIGRREEVPPQQALEMIMVKPQMLLDIFDMKANRDWSMREQGIKTGKEGKYLSDRAAERIVREHDQQAQGGCPPKKGPEPQQR